jgi:hypothetical protein
VKRRLEWRATLEPETASEPESRLAISLARRGYPTTPPAGNAAERRG